MTTIRAVNEANCIRRGFHWVIGILVVLGTEIAYSQDDTANAAPEYLIEEILVTAQKRTASIQDVPLSVTAITGERIAELGAMGIADYVNYVPGLTMNGTPPTGGRNGLRLRIRGIASPGSVGYYIGEAPIVPVDLSLFDLERVEILRGPQGTLYGSNSLVGLVKIVPNVPDASQLSLLGGADISYTDGGSQNLTVHGVVNVPILEDRLAARFVVYNQDDSGYIDRIPFGLGEITSPNVPDPTSGSFAEPAVFKDDNDMDRFGARGSIGFNLSDSTEITASFLVQDTTSNNGNLIERPFDKLSLTAFQALPFKEEISLLNVSLSHDFRSVNLFLSSSVADRESYESVDFAPFFATAFGVLTPNSILQSFNKDKQDTHEVRLSSRGDGRLTWSLGAFASDQERGFDQFLAPGQFNAEYNRINDLDSDFELVPDNKFFIGNREEPREETAVFGELSYEFFDRLSVTAGLRWFELKENNERQEDGFFNGGPSTTSESAKEDGVNPKFYVGYKATDDALVYAVAAQGFRPGGTNGIVPTSLCAADLANIGLTEAPSSYTSDTLWNYELGAKTSWWNQRGTVNFSVYHIDWSDIPQAVDLPGCGFSFTANVGEASSKGAELEVNASPIDGLDLNVALSYVDAQLERDGLGGVRGDRLRDIPEWVFALGSRYSFPAMGGGDAFVQVDYQYVGDRVGSENIAGPPQDLESYNIVNLRAGVGSDAWEANFYVNNVTNELPQLFLWSQFGVPNLPEYGTSLRPRTVGLRLIFRY